MKNWAGQHHCNPRKTFIPLSSKEVESVILEAISKQSSIRAFGTGHSPNDIAMSSQCLLLTQKLNKVLDVNEQSSLIRVQAGATLQQIVSTLYDFNLALPVLPSILEQTIAGAVATATHGTGIGYSHIGSYIKEARIVTSSSGTLIVNEQSEILPLNALRCNLGALGILTELTLEAVPIFDLVAEERMTKIEEILENLPERLSHDHYRFWYIPHTNFAWEWFATRQLHKAKPHQNISTIGRLYKWYNTNFIGRDVFQFLLWLSTWKPTLLPSINKWYSSRFFSSTKSSRDLSHSQFTFDCFFKQYVSEWSIPINNLANVIKELQTKINSSKFPAHLPVEIRFSSKDNTWLSPAYGYPVAYVGIISYVPFNRQPNHSDYFKFFEKIMRQNQGRPHWAKDFQCNFEELRTMYPRWDDFQKIRYKCDQQGIFMNEYIERTLGPLQRQL